MTDPRRHTHRQVPAPWPLDAPDELEELPQGRDEVRAYVRYAAGFLLVCAAFAALLWFAQP